VVESKYESSWGGWSSSEFVGPYGMGLWKNVWRGCEKFSILSNLRRKMAPKLDYGMIFGVEIWPLRKACQFYLVLPAQMMLVLRLIWNVLEILFSET
jgi:hypothetical protein